LYYLPSSFSNHQALLKKRYFIFLTLLFPTFQPVITSIFFIPCLLLKKCCHITIKSISSDADGHIWTILTFNGGNILDREVNWQKPRSSGLKTYFNL
jgi:hypothetical protein